MKAKTQARITLIGGMDPSGGAGLLRDAWTCEELATQRGMELELDALCTGLTRQRPGTPATRVEPALWGIEDQLRRLRGEIWKIGMLPELMVPPLLDRLNHTMHLPRTVIFDPVQRASAGGLLGAAPDRLGELWGHCDWVTPNRGEALSFGARPGEDGAPWELGPFLGKARSCWIKSTHREQGRVIDELHLPEAVIRVGRDEQAGPDPRGTGCALASALAVGCAGTLAIERRADESLEVWRQGAWRSEGIDTLQHPETLGPVLWASRWLALKRTQARPQGEAWFLPLLG